MTLEFDVYFSFLIIYIYFFYLCSFSLWYAHKFWFVLKHFNIFMLILFFIINFFYIIIKYSYDSWFVLDSFYFRLFFFCVGICGYCLVFLLCYSNESCYKLQSIPETISFPLLLLVFTWPMLASLRPASLSLLIK